MDTKIAIVVLMSLCLAIGFVAVAPTTTAHTCSGLIPTDCGPCTSGYHSHTWCSSSGDNLLLA